MRVWRAHGTAITMGIITILNENDDDKSVFDVRYASRRFHIVAVVRTRERSVCIKYIVYASQTHTQTSTHRILTNGRTDYDDDDVDNDNDESHFLAQWSQTHS